MRTFDAWTELTPIFSDLVDGEYIASEEIQTLATYLWLEDWYSGPPYTWEAPETT